MNNVPYYKITNYPKVTPTLLVKTVASTATPEAASATDLYCTTMVLTGRKAARTPNTGDVYVGWTSTNDAQPYKITSDGEVWFNAPEGAKWNLAELYIDVTTNADGLVILYW